MTFYPRNLTPTPLQLTLSEWKTLAVLGAPILIAQLAQMANGVVDTMMAGHASARDLAAVGIGTGVWIPILLFFSGTIGALQPIVSGHRGAQDFTKIIPMTWQGIYIALVSSIALGLILNNMRPLLELLQLDIKTTEIAQDYLNALIWGAPAILLLNSLRGLTDGMGHTRVIMCFSLLSSLLNFPLNYILVFGHYGFPAMGGAGCGWATTISNWVALGSLLVYLSNNHDYKHLHLVRDWVKPQWENIRTILQLGLPIGLAMFVEVSMFCMIALILSPLGPTVIASHQIVLNAISLFFMVPLSLGMALTLRISYLIGANELYTAHLLSRSAIFLGLGMACINAPIFYFGRDFLATLYTDDIEVQKIAAELFTLGAIFQIADVTQVTMVNVLRGYKDTKIPMLIMLVSFWGICLPLGYILTYKDWLHAPMGAAGFWTALIAGLSCAACLLTIRLFTIKTPFNE